MYAMLEIQRKLPVVENESKCTGSPRLSADNPGVPQTHSFHVSKGCYLPQRQNFLTHLTEHFNEVMNRPPPTEEVDVRDPDVDLDADITPPVSEATMAAIRSVMNQKAHGQDSLNAFQSSP